MRSAQKSAYWVAANLRLLFACGSIAILLAAPRMHAQDDLTTQNGSSALNGGWITGPASNPLSLLNGPAYRTFGKTIPYDFPDFHPMTSLDRRLPPWIAFQAEERLRFEGYTDGSFQPGNNDSYLLNRFRLQADLRPTSWIRFSAQVQDSRPMYQKPPYGPPNENRWDLKLAYTEFGNPVKHSISVRVGRQLINYNNTIIASSEWRNQGRSYDAVVTNLQSGRFHLGIFAASAVVPLASGISHHQQGNNIYGIYGRFSSVNSKIGSGAIRTVACAAERRYRSRSFKRQGQAKPARVRSAMERPTAFRVRVLRSRRV